MDEDRWRTRLRWVVHPGGPQVLLGRRDGSLVLPEVERPGQLWTADPDEVLPALRELLGADALLLDCLDQHEDPTARVQRATLLAVPREAPALPEGMAWVGRDGLAAARAAGGPAGNAAVAARVVEGLGRGPDRDGGQPWAARGWFAEAERWLRATMERLGRPVTGTVRQARVWRLSCVLRAPTGDGDVWFKANTTSPLFVNEGVVMGALAGLFPGQVPAPLAVDPERGWMVLADFGEEVGWEAPLQVVQRGQGPGGYLFFDWTDACVAHPFFDLATIRRGTAFTDAACEDELRERLREAYLPEWASFEPPGRLARAWELAAPLGALHQAVSYRSLATQPPMDPHMAQSTAFWLRRVLALA